MTENEKYRSEHYPNLYPCKHCHYWRSFARTQLKMCLYSEIEGKLRGCEPDLINRTCKKFKKREKK